MAANRNRIPRTYPELTADQDVHPTTAAQITESRAITIVWESAQYRRLAVRDLGRSRQLSGVTGGARLPGLAKRGALVVVRRRSCRCVHHTNRGVSQSGQRLRCATRSVAPG